MVDLRLNGHKKILTNHSHSRSSPFGFGSEGLVEINRICRKIRHIYIIGETYVAGYVRFYFNVSPFRCA